jgi:hypothetical protein
MFAVKNQDDMHENYALKTLIMQYCQRHAYMTLQDICCATNISNDIASSLVDCLVNGENVLISHGLTPQRYSIRRGVVVRPSEEIIKTKDTDMVINECNNNNASAAVWPCRNQQKPLWSEISDSAISVTTTTDMQDIDKQEEILLDGLIACMQKIDCNDVESGNNKGENDDENNEDSEKKKNKNDENIQKFFDENPHVTEAVFSMSSDNDDNNDNNNNNNNIDKNTYPAEISIRDVLINEFKSGKQYTVFNLLKIVQQYNDHAHYKAVHKELFMLRDDKYIKAIFTKPVRWVTL